MFLNLANLNGAHSFARWTGGAPDEYTRTVVNTTEVQLNRTDPRDHPQRVLFRTSPVNRGDPYIYEGPSSYRAILAGAAVADNWSLRPTVAYPCRPYSQTRVSIWYRGDPAAINDVLRFRIILQDAVPAITYYLNNDEQWQAGDAYVTWKIQPIWTEMSASFQMPSMADAHTWYWQVSNGSPGAQIIDLGQVWVPDPIYQEAAGGV